MRKIATKIARVNGTLYNQSNAIDHCLLCVEPASPFQKIMRAQHLETCLFLSLLSLYLSLYLTFRRARARSCHVFEIRQPQQSVAHHSHQDCGKKELGTTEQSLFEHFGIPK